MRKRRKILIVILIVVVFYSFIIHPILTYNNVPQDQKAFLEKQEEYLEKLTTLTETLDDSTSLYLTSDISQEEYLSCVDSIAMEYIVISKAYIKDTPEEIEKLTEDEQKKIESLQNCYLLIGDLLAVCRDEKYVSDKENLSYQYLSAQNAISEQLKNYLLLSEEE